MTRTTSAMRATLAVLVLSAGGHFAQAQEERKENQAAPRPVAAAVTVAKRAYDRQALVNAPALPENVHRGRTVWLQRCAYCHDGVGQPSYKTLGPWLGAETIERFSEDGFRAFVANGTERMPGWQYTLKPEQVNDVIAFLKTVPSDQKPTALQLAGGKPGGGSGD